MTEKFIAPELVVFGDCSHYSPGNKSYENTNKINQMRLFVGENGMREEEEAIF